MKQPVHPPADATVIAGAQPLAITAPRSLSRRALAHELQVHQVELEQQNEELRAAQRDLALAHDRYIDLFDHAPVGYVTLDREGRVTEANLTAASELGVDRTAMLGCRFLQYMVPADSDRWQRLQTLALRQRDPTRIELRLLRRDGRQFDAQLDCLRVPDPDAQAQLRVTITDVSQRKLAERDRRIAVSGNLAREAERRQLAHGLHEDLGQRLCALKMTLAALQSPVGRGSVQATIDAMSAQLDEALVVARRMSSDLHPLILDHLGLAAAMEWMLRDIAARRGLEVELHLDETPQVDEAAGIAIYRLAEAVLEEVSRQVAGGVSMEILQRPDDLVLRFRCEPGRERDGGSAVALAEVPESIRDQVHLLAGRLELDEPVPGTCRISIFLPIARLAVA